MKITKITMSKTFNTGNYTSKRFELEATIAAKEDVTQARIDLEVELNRLALIDIKQVAIAQQVLDDPYNFSQREIDDAQNFMNSIKRRNK